MGNWPSHRRQEQKEERALEAWRPGEGIRRRGTQCGDSKVTAGEKAQVAGAGIVQGVMDSGTTTRPLVSGLVSHW